MRPHRRDLLSARSRRPRATDSRSLATLRYARDDTVSRGPDTSPESTSGPPALGPAYATVRPLPRPDPVSLPGTRARDGAAANARAGRPRAHHAEARPALRTPAR